MPKLALSMIVRDAAATLRDCLNSVKGLVDEIVIADTGSVDETADIAREYGAKVISIPWQDDFAGARNLALAEVTADWVLSLDADEVLDPQSAAEVRALLENTAIGGYQITIRNYVLSLEDRIWDRPAQANDSRLPAAQSYPAYVEHENVRLFRRDSRIQFIGRVHESVGPSIERSGLRLGQAPLLIHHFGLACNAETRARKNVLYRELGKQKILEMPDHFQAHFELGLVELDNFENVEEARRLFDHACALNRKSGVAWFFAGLACVKLGEYRAAVKRLKEAQKQGHKTSFVLETLGDAHYNVAEFPQAARAYERAMEKTEDSSLLQSKLGLAVIRAGHTQKGLASIRAAIERNPAHPELHDRLILSLAWLGKDLDAATAAEQKLRSVPAPLPSDFLRSAHLWAALGEWARSAAILHVGATVYPQNSVLKEALAELSEREGRQAQEVFERLTSEVEIGVRNRLQT